MLRQYGSSILTSCLLYKYPSQKSTIPSFAGRFFLFDFRFCHATNSLKDKKRFFFARQGTTTT